MLFVLFELQNNAQSEVSRASAASRELVAVLPGSGWTYAVDLPAYLFLFKHIQRLLQMHLYSLNISLPCRQSQLSPDAIYNQKGKRGAELFCVFVFKQRQSSLWDIIKVRTHAEAPEAPSLRQNRWTRRYWEDPSTHSESLGTCSHTTGLNHSNEDGNISQRTPLPSCYTDTKCIIWSLKEKTKQNQTTFLTGACLQRSMFRVQQ